MAARIAPAVDIYKMLDETLGGFSKEKYFLAPDALLPFRFPLLRSRFPRQTD
jgi:hypothetical protein